MITTRTLLAALLVVGIPSTAYTQTDSVWTNPAESIQLASAHPKSMPAGSDFYHPLEAFRVALLRRVHYPYEALHMGLEGTVMIRVELRADNQIGQVRIVRSAGPWLDKAVLQAVREVHQGIPHDDLDVPIRQAIDYPIVFRP